MFWTPEDIQPVVDAAKSVFGTVGNMSEEPNTCKNVHVETARFGTVWYGDVEGGIRETVSRKEVLEKLINERVTVRMTTPNSTTELTA